MELGINTDYEAEYVKIEEIEESIRRIAAAGFSHMHWCYEWDGDYIYSRSEMEQIRGWMDKYGLKAKSLHSSKGSRGVGNGRMDVHYRKDYTSTIEYNRVAGGSLSKTAWSLRIYWGPRKLYCICICHILIMRKNRRQRKFFTDRHISRWMNCSPSAWRKRCAFVLKIYMKRRERCSLSSLTDCLRVIRRNFWGCAWIPDMRTWYGEMSLLQNLRIVSRIACILSISMTILDGVREKVMAMRICFPGNAA